jgi:CBS domain-containing protein
MNPSQLRITSISDFVTHADVLRPEDPFSKAIAVLRDTNSYEVLIDHGEKSGVVSVRDLLDANEITTPKLSTIVHNVPFLTSQNTVLDAASLMYEYRMRTLPFRSGNKTSGQVNAKSILDKLMETDNPAKLSSLMTPSPICVNSDDDVSKARRLMLTRKIDQIPILADGKLDGVITSSSIVFNMSPATDRNLKGNWRRSRYGVPVSDFAPEAFCSNGLRDSVNSVYRDMTNIGTQYSVLTNMDEVQGIITYRDFMRLLVEPRSPDSIPMYIVGLPEDPFEAEAAREKFTRIVKFLQKGMPLTEARAVIKAKDKKFARTVYEVQIFLSTVNEHFSYKGTGYELPDVFDGITNWSKHVASKESEGKRKRRTRSDAGEPTP